MKTIMRVIALIVLPVIMWAVLIWTAFGITKLIIWLLTKSLA